MKAAFFKKHGGPEELRLVQVSVGEPGPGEIRIRHKAVGLNFIDVYQRSGLYPQSMPVQLGMEAAGVVEAVGCGRHPPAGGRPCGLCQQPARQLLRGAGDAGQVRVQAARWHWFRYRRGHDAQGPDGPVPAAPHPAQGGLQAGDFVLFHAAAGGVGLIACQWAKALGLQLIGTAGSDAKCALAKEHGAAHVINYNTEDFLVRVKEITGGKGVKVVYDSIGKDTWDKSLDCLAPFGLMASFGNASGPVPPFAPGILAPKGSLYVTRQTLFAHIATREATQAMADELFAVVLSGAVKIRIDQRFALEEVQAAHRALEARQTTGCTILTL